MRPAISAHRQISRTVVGLAAHLAEVDCTVFSADVLFALVVGWLRLR